MQGDLFVKGSNKVGTACHFCLEFCFLLCDAGLELFDLLTQLFQSHGWQMLPSLVIWRSF